MTDNNTYSTQPPTQVSMIAGGLAGLTVDLALYPLDTLKTRLQSSEGFIKAGGFRGVYKGMQSVALGSAPGSAAFFVAYEQSAPFFAKFVGHSNTRQINGTNYTIAATNPIGHLLAAIVGEFCACLIRVPTDQLKMRMQAGHAVSLSTAFQQTQKMSSLYSGFGVTLTREIPFSLIQFPLYEYLKRTLYDYKFRYAHDTLGKDFTGSCEYAQISPLQGAVIGSLCGFISAGLTTPLDVSRTRIMLGADPYGEKYTINPITTMKRIFVEGSRFEKAYQQTINEQLQQHVQQQTTQSTKFQLPQTQLTSIRQNLQNNPHSHPNILPGELFKYSRGGINALFRGVVPRTTWISIGGCVYFGVFEAAKKMLYKPIPVNLSPNTTSTMKKD